MSKAWLLILFLFLASFASAVYAETSSGKAKVTGFEDLASKIEELYAVAAIAFVFAIVAVALAIHKRED